MYTCELAFRAQDLCESRGGRPGLPVPNKSTVSVDIKQHFNQKNWPEACSPEIFLSLWAAAV